MRFVRHQDLRLTRLDNEGVALHMGERKYFTLNDTGTTLIEALAAPLGESDLVRLLCERYDVTPELAQPTVSAFLAECLAAQLVREVT